ncbi:hypothetical protein DES53_101981 [Roseimicrobium gellanilyticum]|uniref:Uncharacterized protein n=1 Tax=Roseimicrobium gellanilyticum TaxID=748857 RepID=A0A366HV63_9BACT|nr:hypothetical protein DES53_101981 [Roseimicrobium gellanilyticum]
MFVNKQMSGVDLSCASVADEIRPQIEALLTKIVPI